MAFVQDNQTRPAHRGGSLKLAVNTHVTRHRWPLAFDFLIHYHSIYTYSIVLPPYLPWITRISFSEWPTFTSFTARTSTYATIRSLDRAKTKVDQVGDKAV